VWFQENAVILGHGASGNAVDLAAYIARDLKTSDYVSSLFVAKVGTKVWGIPHGANPVALAYNKSVFTAAGEAFPTSSWTYNDMIAAAKRIQAKNDQIYAFLTNTSITTGWFPWIKAYGGSCLTDNLTKANFLDAKTKAGVVAWANTYSVDGIAPSAGENKQALFGSNAGAMYFLQYSEAVTMNKTYPQLNWDTAMIPKAVDGSGKRYVPNLSNSWFIWSGAKKDNQDAAWEWIKFYLNAQSQDLVAQMGAALPVRISSMSKISTSTKPYNKAAFTEGIAQGGVSMDENPTWDQWRRVVNNALGGVYDDPTTVDAALAQLQTDVQAILDK